MYKEIVIDPKCMSEYEFYGLVKKDFGFDKGRYLIAELPDWAKKSYQAAVSSDMKPVKKKSVTQFLNKLIRSKRHKYDGIFLPKDRAEFIKNISFGRELGWNGKLDWDQWCEKQNEYRSFSATISNSGVQGSITYDDILGEPECWNSPPSIRVRRTPVNIVDAFHSLLVISQNILIVDPYLTLSDIVLKEIFSRLSLYPNLTSMTMVTAIEINNPQKVFDKEYLKILKSSIQVKLIIAPKGYFHDRYLITERGALQLGQGYKSENFRKGTHTDTLKISFFSHDDARDVKKHVKDIIDENKAIHYELC